MMKTQGVTGAATSGLTSSAMLTVSSATADGNPNKKASITEKFVTMRDGRRHRIAQWSQANDPTLATFPAPGKDVKSLRKLFETTLSIHHPQMSFPPPARRTIMPTFDARTVQKVTNVAGDPPPPRRPESLHGLSDAMKQLSEYEIIVAAAIQALRTDPQIFVEPPRATPEMLHNFLLELNQRGGQLPERNLIDSLRAQVLMRDRIIAMEKASRNN